LKIKPHEFVDHHTKNYPTKQQELNLDDYNFFTKHEENDLSTIYNDFIRQIADKKKIIEIIYYKGNPQDQV
jgi:hypothetical protein